MILFLDFDGVLHPDAAYMDRHGVYLDTDLLPVQYADCELFCYAPALAGLLSEFPMVRIVLSTSWCWMLDFKRAKSRLPVEIQKRVIGSTWHSAFREGDPRWTLMTRYQQINSYVTRHQIVTWLAVDDDPDGDWPTKEENRLVRCDSLDGLGRAETIEELRDKLKGNR